MACGGRPSGWPRIATCRSRTKCSRMRRWRSPSGVTEDYNKAAVDGLVDAGLWRSTSGVTVDRNLVWAWHVATPPIVTVTLRGPRIATPRQSIKTSTTRRCRSPFVAAEDRKQGSTRIPSASRWRSSSGAAVDRNIRYSSSVVPSWVVAVALRATEHRNADFPAVFIPAKRGCGCPPGRLRIVISTRVGGADPSRSRSYFGPTEARNEDVMIPYINWVGEWWSLSGTTEDHNMQYTGLFKARGASGGCPSGRPRIATSSSASSTSPPARGGRPRVDRGSKPGVRPVRALHPPRGGRSLRRPTIATTKPVAVGPH